LVRLTADTEPVVWIFTLLTSFLLKNRTGRVEEKAGSLVGARPPVRAYADFVTLTAGTVMVC
jgi:hypothetical protein